MGERDRVEQEAEAAAEEAGAIGGRTFDEDTDPAEQPVREGGGGESEGFEIAEEDLREHAEHGNPGPDPSHMAAEPEAASDRETVERGDADGVRTTERPGDT
ncbi:MAG: hypothetical protein H0U84_00245 [Thermoleophilaceae bacterium]|nr:hypothetical protein [Thermoleophilaceae bacterium]